jgi:FkbM family methyltransferase
MIKKFVSKLFGSSLDPVRRKRALEYHKKGRPSFGQEGEDRVISSLLFKLHGGYLPQTGFFIDIGAHHPFLYSNTYGFYKIGWSGLNIDAAPGSMTIFQKYRPRDINVEIGVGRQKSKILFHVFNEPALSTFDEQLAKARAVPPREILEVIPVEVAPAAEIFGRYLKPGQKIDFMTVDVEGLDMEVLQSNDWIAYRPMIVAVEIYNRSVSEAASDEISMFLESKNYIFYAKTVNTAFFVDKYVLEKIG